MTIERQPANDLIERDRDGKLTGKATEYWSRFIRGLTDLIDIATKAVGHVELTGLTALHASLAPTVVMVQELNAGDYLVTYAMRVEAAAGVTSDVTLTISWPDGGVVISKDSALMNGNTIGTHEEGAFPIHVDSGGPITYSTAYNSNPATAMRHSLRIRAVEIPA